MTLHDLVEPELSDLAIELDGEPVPGLRMSEQQFNDWYWRTENTRAEWVDGEIILLSPINIPEFRLNIWLFKLVESVVDADEGEVFGIEIQIRLPTIKQRRNPDVLFISRNREKIIKHSYIDGAPDLVMEIVSPDSENRDRRDKFLAYEKSGVREYWIIDPNAQRVEAYSLNREKKYRRIKEAEGVIESKVIRKLFIRPTWLWQSPLPKLAKVLKELSVR
jgi:Uma2 family endonuclease